MALQTNSVTLPIGYNIISPVPLDGRTVAEYKQDLIDKDVWATDKAYQYIGMPVYVQEDQSIYVLKEKIDYENLLDFSNPQSLPSEEQKNELYKAWKKLASASDVESLSGVFQFKGVAEAINQDQSIITTHKVATTVVTDEKGNVITPSEPLYCVTTAYEFDMDVYYGWGTSLNDIRFWTDTTTVNNNTYQYDKGAEKSVTAYEFNGELYYPIDSTVAPTAADPVTQYESVDGRIIYITEAGEVYDNDQAAGGPIGDATPIAYTGCDFSVKSSIALEENTTSETIAASPDNSGHVYQIGENEYASNGQIWVKLGSPVEDWIIL